MLFIKCYPNLALSVVVTTIFIGNATGAVIVGTDFAGTTENGMVLEDIVYTATGATVAASATDLAVTNTNTAAGSSGNLTTTAAADGFFAVSNNTGNGGEWNLQIEFTVGPDDVILDDFVFDWQNFNGSGGNQNALRNTEITFDILQSGSTVISGPLAQNTAIVNTVNDGVQTDDFDLTGTTLTAGTTYTLFLQAGDATTGGNNFGFDAITLNGTVVPEPSSAALLALAGLVVGLRRRR